MKEFHFSEEQLNNIRAIGQSLFDDPSDPRSWNYERKLVRPRIKWRRIILFSFSVIGSALLLYFLLIAFNLPFAYALLISAAYALTVILLYLKRILICLIHIYQRFAPDSLRNKCRFEPSCSQYMILSLQKYGLWHGLAKGIKRLRRCNTNDGGFDYP